jgi:cellulose synthase/poly-beta-1,6-N-acetylglucosamine synthase-like glycosyltransferase
VSGRIQYVNEDDSSITVSAGTYWRLEEKLRSWESALGILAFGTGAAFCIRRELYEPISANEDIDYALSMSVVQRGYRVAYEPEAIAFDLISATLNGAHRARVRQTSRASKSILGRLFKTPALVTRPGILFSVLSHKTLRHLTPFLMLSLVASNFFLWSFGEWYYLTMICQLVFYFLALLGGIGYLLGWKLKPLAFPFTFVVLNSSRLWGMMDALFRSPPSVYR